MHILEITWCRGWTALCGLVCKLTLALRTFVIIGMPSVLKCAEIYNPAAASLAMYAVYNRKRGDYRTACKTDVMPRQNRLCNCAHVATAINIA